MQFLALNLISTLAYTQRENLSSLALACFCTFQSIGYDSYLAFNIHPCARFSMFQFKIPSLLESYWNYLEFWNSS